MRATASPTSTSIGLTLPVRLPQVDTVEGGVWSAQADIDSCPDLELVLPARKEAVETPFLEEMREAAGLAVYRAMAQARSGPAGCLDRLAQGERGGDRDARAARRTASLAFPPSPTRTIGTSGPLSQA